MLCFDFPLNRPGQLSNWYKRSNTYHRCMYLTEGSFLVQPLQCNVGAESAPLVGIGLSIWKFKWDRGCSCPCCYVPASNNLLAHYIARNKNLWRNATFMQISYSWKGVTYYLCPTFKPYHFGKFLQIILNSPTIYIHVDILILHTRALCNACL